MSDGSDKQCIECGLYKECLNPMMAGQGCTENPLVMFVATSPLWEENEANKYWIKATQTLKIALEEVGLDINEHVYYTSLLKCPTLMPTSAQIKACQGLLFDEIEKVNPRIIVPMDNDPLKVLMGMTGITKSRGKAVEKDGRVYLPIMHPHACARQPKHWEGFVSDINTLKGLIEEGMSIKLLGENVDYRYLDTVDAALDEIGRLEREADWVTVDIETTGSNPFAEGSKIITIGLTDKERYGVCIPLYHRETPFNTMEIGTIVKRLRRLLQSKTIKFVAHNGKFEIKWLEVVLGIYMTNVVFDTLLAHYIGVTEEQGTHDLKGLAWHYTDMGGYDNALDEFKKTLPEADRHNYDLIPLKILWKYNAGDADCTHRLIEPLTKSVDQDEQIAWIFDNLLMPASYAFKDIESFGMKVNTEYLQQVLDVYPTKIEELNESLHSYSEILEVERERLKKYEQYLMEKQKPKDTRDLEIMKYEKYKKEGYKFNFASVPQVQDLLFVRLGLPVVAKTKTGAPSTNEEALEILQHYHDIPKIMLEFRKVSTLNNMFIQKIPSLLDLNNIIHPSYLLHGTVTGRTSSEDPNAQQFPRKVSDPWLFQYQWEIKKLFDSRWGKDGLILQFDYSQLELRVAAVLSGDDFMLEVYREGRDLHREIAAKVYKIPIEEVTPEQRTKAKKVNFGIIYGISAAGLAADPEVDMTYDEAQKFIREYFKIVPKLKKWLDKTTSEAKRDKYVRTMFGRYRRLSSVDSSESGIRNGALREAVNAPVQGTGSDMTLMSIIIINNMLKERNLKTRIFVTVHDSIGFDVYRPELAEVIDIVKNTMEHLPFEFLGDVPIVSEMELGVNYGELFELSSYQQLEESGGFDTWLDKQYSKKAAKEKEKWEKYYKKLAEMESAG